MVNIIGSYKNDCVQMHKTFGQSETAKKQKSQCENKDVLLLDQREKAPLRTSAKITADKLGNAFTTYPIKGFLGSKNANFYEFLTMGMVPNLIGSAMLIGVFNGANKFFDQASKKSASLAGKKMAAGVILYSLMKNVSKKLIELPVKAKYNVDINLPYDKEISEIPDKHNQKDLISHESHKVFESVDFPRWDLLYGLKKYGDDNNAYYNHVAQKMGYTGDLKDSDQLMKPKIKELIIKTRTFSTLASYLWAAVGVGIGSQDAWGTFKSNVHLADRVKYLFKRPQAKEGAKIITNTANSDLLITRVGKTFVKSCKEFVSGGKNHSKPAKYAALGMLGLATGVTLLGNLLTLVDFNKKKSDKLAATSLIDNGKSKVVC